MLRHAHHIEYKSEEFWGIVRQIARGLNFGVKGWLSYTAGWHVLFWWGYWAPRLIPEYFAVLPGFADQELWPRTLLTNGLFRRDKQRAGAARPTFSPQTETTRPALPGLASRKNPVLWAFFRVFMWPVNRQTAFRNKYLRPQVHLGTSPIG